MELESTVMMRSVIFSLVFITAFSRSMLAQTTYKPAEAASVTDAFVSYQVVIDGLFVLDVFIDEDGNLHRVDALRDPGGMLGAAKASVRSWKFHAASKNGKPEPSRITVSFVYRPLNYGNAAAVPPKDFAPVIPPEASGTGEYDGYVPIGIVSFVYPDYPANSVARGSVVVQLTVDESGKVVNIDFLHGMTGFNGLVSKALEKWQFRAATFQGKPVTSKTAVAFVFQPPSSN